MSAKQKYLMLVAVVAAIFFYVLSTEVYERWSGAFELYEEVLSKEHDVMSPEELSEKKTELVLRKRTLTEQLMKGSVSVEQSQLGVVKFLHSCAKGTEVSVQSLVPLESQSDVKGHSAGQTKELGFRLDLTAHFHQVSFFVNAIETGALPIQIGKLELTAQKVESPLLQIGMEGKAYVFAKGALR